MASSSQSNGLRQQRADDLQGARKLLRATLDSSRDMIQVFEAVRNQQGEIIDFIWLLNNHASEKIYGDVVGKSLLQRQPGVVEEGIFAAFKQVVETGLPQQYEKHYVHEQFDGWFHQSVVKLNDGVVTTTTDISSRKTAEDQLKQSQAFLQSVIDSSLDVIQVFKAVRDETGSILDFVWIMNNQKAVDQNGDVIGKSLLKLNPGVVATGIFDHMIEVAQTGVAYEHEQYYNHEQFNGWFYQALVKTDDGVAMTTRDITQAKQAGQQILRLKDEAAQKATNKYLTLFNSIYQGFALCELIRDENGQGVDHRILELNPAFEKQTGISLQNQLGRKAREVFPTLDRWWTETYTTLVDTGKPTSFEHYFKEVQRWYEIGAYPMQGDQFAVLYNDITERKNGEQQQTFLLRFSDTLRTETTADAVANRAIQLLTEQLGLDRCYLVTYRVEEDRADLDYQIGNDNVPPLPDHFVLSNYPEAFKTTFEKTVVIEDEWERQGLSEAEKRNSEKLGMRAMVGATLRKENKPLWSMVAISSRPRRWTKGEIALVEEVAERTWAALERAKAEEALRESQKRFESIANLVPDLLWDSKPEGSTNWFNQRWLEYTGQRFEQAIGWGWTDAIHPDDREGSARRYSQAVEAGNSLRQEHRIRRHDGEYRWFVVSASPLKDEHDHVVNMYGAATDIHELKRLEAALRETDRRKDEFLAMLAHELRNPMSTIRSGLQILSLTEGKDQTRRDTIAMMNRQTDHLVHLVDDLLDVSRISRGKIELKKERVNLVELVQQVVESLHPLFSGQGKILHVKIPTAPIELEGDATRLVQILTNLLTNAARYTGEQGQVWLCLEQNGGEALIQVQDNGIGIPAEQLSAIFELFVQVDTSLARSKGGLGLGLTLVKRLVDRHGGRVEAQSEGPGKGSTFTVHLPTLPSPAESMDKPAPQPADSVAAQRILVIDDNADAVFTLATLLKLKGYETHTRTSGRAGIGAAEQLRPAAILLDIGMPELDGYATCRLIRAQAWGSNMVVIALTGYGHEEDRQRTTEAGFDGHLVKPVDLGALTKMLTDLLEKDDKPPG